MNRWAKLTNRAALFAASCLLVGCGGGGSDGSASAPAISPIAGGWQGTSSTGRTVLGVVLDDGTWWAIAGLAIGNALYPDELYHGQVAAAGGTLSSGNLRGYGFTSGNTISGSLSGTYTANTQITATATPTGSTSGVRVNLAVAPPAVFNYSQPAQLASISGIWTGFFSSFESGTVQVQPNGNFSTVTSRGCAIIGTLAPHGSGKNVFAVTATFGAAPCTLANTVVSGIAVVTGSGAAAQIAVGVTTSDRSRAGAYFGRR